MNKHHFYSSVIKGWIFSWMKPMNTRTDAEVKKYKELADKHFQLYMLMTQWVKLKQEGKSLATPLVEKGIHHVAIYGMNYVGERLLAEFADSEVTVNYAIDRNADNQYCSVELLKPENPLPEVDAIIVTAIVYFADIEESLSEKVSCPIFSIDDLMFQ